LHVHAGTDADICACYAHASKYARIHYFCQVKVRLCLPEYTS
jgi:hypothetical protein